jgi:hypothetical protein
MKKLILLLLCIFSLSFGYTQIDTFKKVKVDVPSVILIKPDSVHSVYVPDTTLAKCLNVYVYDGTLYINYLKPYYRELMKEIPIKMRITTPDSLHITTGRDYRKLR